jgi:hypothetical protein
VPARELGKPDAGCRARSGDKDRGEHIARPQCRLEQAFEEMLGLYGSRALRARDRDLAIHRNQAGGQLGSGVGECNGATQRPAMADRGMTDMGFRS